MSNKNKNKNEIKMKNKLADILILKTMGDHQFLVFLIFQVDQLYVRSI